ncbi:hypothetical protein NFI96_009918 [Prochilodus magdalenae]|nr:hypothetical protein NFI96_009918 [Prochilodus magdalenae]
MAAAPERTITPCGGTEIWGGKQPRSGLKPGRLLFKHLHKDRLGGASGIRSGSSPPGQRKGRGSDPLPSICSVEPPSAHQPLPSNEGCHQGYAQPPLWNSACSNPTTNANAIYLDPPQDNHRASIIWVVDHSQHCSDPGMVVVVLSWVLH